MTYYSNSLNFPNLTAKTVPVGADILLIGDSAANGQPKQSTIAQVIANNNNFLGQLNDGNSFSSTTILSGYNAYQIIMGNTAGSSGGIFATGSNQIEIGFQLYIGGSFITTGYSTFSSGINGNNQIVGSSVGNSTSESMIVFPAFSASPAIFQLNATLNTVSKNHVLQYSSFSSTVTEQLGFFLNGFNYLTTTGTATGIKLFFGGSGVLTAGSTSYFSVYGIPNT